MTTTDSTTTPARAPGTVPALVRLFIIVWDDEQGLVVPMGFNRDCAGAVCAIGNKDKVALFTDRQAARRAIDISAKFAALCKAQGKPANDDFLGECRKNLRVVECEPNSVIDVTSPKA